MGPLVQGAGGTAGAHLEQADVLLLQFVMGEGWVGPKAVVGGEREGERGRGGQQLVQEPAGGEGLAQLGCGERESSGEAAVQGAAGGRRQFVAGAQAVQADRGHVGLFSLPGSRVRPPNMLFHW